MYYLFLYNRRSISYFLANLRPTLIRKQFLIVKGFNNVTEDIILKTINASNRNSFSNWEERKEYSRKGRVISPVSTDRL